MYFLGDFKINVSNAFILLKDSHVIVDALDNVPDRFVLENAAKKMQLPLIHGAVAGFEGQVSSIFPGDSGLENLYGRGA